MTDVIATQSNIMVKPRSPATIAVDNFLRKALRISDPRDPAQIASALLARYPDEAEKDRRERLGLAYASLVEVTPIAPVSGGATSVELAQAQDDLERDLQTLTTASQLKDIRVELNGWGRAIRQIVSDGLAAARLALDPVQQDRALSARRALTEYARLGRYVGALSDATSNLYFRSFSRSCDVLGGMILVAVGEGLAASGITRSTKMVRASASELQIRRDGVISALRGLTGSIDYQFGQDELPRGIEAYRQLVKLLDQGGQSDLRPLLEETSLAAAMDSLIDLSTGANVDGLRELSTTSDLVVHRFQRLIQIGGSIGGTRSGTGLDAPPLTVFISSLQLFIDAFAGRDSSRLLFVARPAIIVSGIYGVGAATGTTRLLKLVASRGELTAKTERLGCECDGQSLRARVTADYLVSQLDRAIDLYASGGSAPGVAQADERAAAVGHLFKAIATATDANGDNLLKAAEAEAELKAVFETLLDGQPTTGAGPLRMIEELRDLSVAEVRVEQLVASLVTGTSASLFRSRGGVINLEKDSYKFQPGESLVRLLLRATLKTYLDAKPKMPKAIRIPPSLPTSVGTSLPKIASELEDIGTEVGDIAETLEETQLPFDANVNALYASAISPDGNINTNADPGRWLENGSGKKNLTDIADEAANDREGHYRERFVDEMLKASHSFQGGLPREMTKKEISRFFDLSPKVRKALGL